jgi:flagellar assembly factor FliW
MILNTIQFGKLEIEEENILEFKDGLIGFEEYKRFIIVTDKEYEPIFWLVSADDPNLEFPIVNPLLFFPDYDPEVVIESEEKTFFAIVSFRKELSETTINLKAPVIVDIANKTGEQIVINSEKYATDHNLLISKGG